MTAPEEPEVTQAPEGAEAVPGHGPAGSPGGPRDPAAPGEPVLPEQSREDTDVGWGEYPESVRDRLYRDRPPHWDDY
jgi:hypothetical protein